MPVPKFIFVRHGEATHNVAFHKDGEKVFSDPQYKDASLTPTGIEQAIQTGKALANLRILDAWSSPLTRCIQTAQEIYEEANMQSMYLHDSLMECQGGGQACNERKRASEIKKEFSFWNTDFLPEFPPLWLERENATSLNRRMLAFILLLSELYKNASEDSHVLIVSHSIAMTYLTHKAVKNGEYIIMSLQEILEAGA